MAIARVTAVWSGFTGAPGYSNFFFNAFGGGDVVDLEVARVRTFFAAINATLPSVARIDVQAEVAILDEVTGDLIGYSTADTAPAQVIGTGTGAYSAPSGATVEWQTDAVAKGRRLRGRTFLVPLANTAYEANGTLSTVALTTIGNAAAGMVGDGTGPQFVIWSRPVVGSGGSIGSVIGSRVPDKAAVLRSRRD